MSKRIPGGLSVSNKVIADIVGHAAMECYGVVGMAAPSLQDGISKLLPTSRYRRGVVVSSGAEGLHIDLYVVLEHGTNISVVSENLIDRTKFVLKELASIDTLSVQVHVQAMKVRDK